MFNAINPAAVATVLVAIERESTRGRVEVFGLTQSGERVALFGYYVDEAYFASFDSGDGHVLGKTAEHVRHDFGEYCRAFWPNGQYSRMYTGPRYLVEDGQKVWSPDGLTSRERSLAANKAAEAEANEAMRPHTVVSLRFTRWEKQLPCACHNVPTSLCEAGYAEEDDALLFDF